MVLRCLDASLPLSIREMIAEELMKQNRMAASEYSIPIANGIISVDEKKSFAEGLLRFLSRCVANKAISAMPLLNLLRKYVKTYEDRLHDRKEALLLLVEQLESNLRDFETPIPQEVLERAEELSRPLLEQEGDNADLWENAGGGRMF